VDGNGRVWINERPEQFVIMVCGGLGNLHAICLPSWGESQIQSKAVVRIAPAGQPIRPGVRPRS
jgi:hypothetical protein